MPQPNSQPPVIIATLPGAESRRPEVAPVVEALVNELKIGPDRVKSLSLPATLDGGCAHLMGGLLRSRLLGHAIAAICCRACTAPAPTAHPLTLPPPRKKQPLTHSSIHPHTQPRPTGLGRCDDDDRSKDWAIGHSPAVRLAFPTAHVITPPPHTHTHTQSHKTL